MMFIVPSNLPLDEPDYPIYELHPYEVHPIQAEEYTSLRVQLISIIRGLFFGLAVFGTLGISMIGAALLAHNYHKCGALECRIDAPSKAP
jgi:hypothetical protein